MAVDFSEDNSTVEYIEFLGGNDGKIQPEIYGVKAFQISADELTDILVQNNGSDMDDSDGASVAYNEISVGIYRETSGNHWDTIGIGVKDYYRD